MFLSPVKQFSLGDLATDELLGSAWKASGVDTQTNHLLRGIHAFMQQELSSTLVYQGTCLQRPAIDRVEETRYVGIVSVELPRKAFFSRVHNGYVIELPPWLVWADGLLIGDNLYEPIRDYTLDGRFVLLSKGVTPPDDLRLYALGAAIKTWIAERFWGNVFNYQDASPGALRFIRAMHKLATTTCNPAAFGELLAAAVGAPAVSQAAEVLEVIPGNNRLSSVVITDRETLHGGPGDLATVEPGDSVLPGDTVFDSLRWHDCHEPLPDWLTEITIPQRYFTFPTATGGVTVNNVVQGPQSVLELNGLVHVRIPITGSADNVAKFHAAMLIHEQSTKSTLAQFLTNRSNPTAAEVSALNLNWLEVLWSTWARYGVSVSQVRDRPDSVVLQRFAQVRRTMAPWLTHIVHYLMPPSTLNELC